MTTTQTARTKNTLAFPDFYKATRWVEQNQDALKHMTQDQAGKAASEGVGMTITGSNIRAIAETLNIVITRSGKTRVRASLPQDDSRVLAQAIAGLYTQLKLATPPALHALAGH
jgi:hypothetical protein